MYFCVSHGRFLSGSGYPKVMNLKVDGELKEGSVIQGHAEIAWCGGTPSKGIVRYSFAIGHHRVLKMASNLLLTIYT